MEFLVLAALMVAIGLFVWLCTLRGDQTYREEVHEEPPAPDWARLLFVLFFGGLLFLLLAPGIMQGLGK